MNTYKKLVEQAAEKYADRVCYKTAQPDRTPCGEIAEWNQLVSIYSDIMNLPEAKQLIEQIAREAVAHASYEMNFMSKDYGIVFSEGWLKCFMGEE